MMRQKEYLWSKELTTLEKKLFLNILEEAKMLIICIFSTFTQCFYPIKEKLTILATMKLSSAFNLDKAKILSSFTGKTSVNQPAPKDTFPCNRA